jgi:hypothetical protein
MSVFTLSNVQQKEKSVKELVLEITQDDIDESNRLRGDFIANWTNFSNVNSCPTALAMKRVVHHDVHVNHTTIHFAEEDDSCAKNGPTWGITRELRDWISVWDGRGNSRPAKFVIPEFN